MWYQLIQNLVAPGKPTDKTFTQLIKPVKDHHHLWLFSIAARKNFHKHTRKPEESVNDFVVELCKLLECCNFGDTLNQILLCGSNNHQLQGKVLAESDLTFDKSFHYCNSLAKQGTKLIESSSLTLQVTSAPCKFQKKSWQPKNHSSSYFRCGGNHTPTGCRFKDVTTVASRATSPKYATAGNMIRIANRSNFVGTEKALNSTT